MRLIFLVFRFIKIFNNKNLLLYIITKILNFLFIKNSQIIYNGIN